MSSTEEPDPPRESPARQDLKEELTAREKLKIKARQERNRTIWFGLGMFGLVGWSVVIPTLAGIALGLWIDSQWPSRFSWTMMLMAAGLFLGCLNAWRWIQQESRDRDHEP